MEELSYQKRKNYEHAQSQFWKYAENAESIQTKWFEELLAHQDYILLVAKSETKIVGFVIGNMLMKDGKLSAVIDFGGMGMGDPACDLVIAWTYLKGKSRGIFY